MRLYRMPRVRSPMLIQGGLSRLHHARIGAVSRGEIQVHVAFDAARRPAFSRLDALDQVVVDDVAERVSGGTLDAPPYTSLMRSSTVVWPWAMGIKANAASRTSTVRFAMTERYGRPSASAPVPPAISWPGVVEGAVLLKGWMASTFSCSTHGAPFFPGAYASKVMSGP